MVFQTQEKAKKVVGNAFEGKEWNLLSAKIYVTFVFGGAEKRRIYLLGLGEKIKVNKNFRRAALPLPSPRTNNFQFSKRWKNFSFLPINHSYSNIQTGIE